MVGTDIGTLPMLPCPPAEGGDQDELWCMATADRQISCSPPRHDHVDNRDRGVDAGVLFGFGTFSMIGGKTTECPATTAPDEVRIRTTAPLRCGWGSGQGRHRVEETVAPPPH